MGVGHTPTLSLDRLFTPVTSEGGEAPPRPGRQDRDRGGARLTLPSVSEWDWNDAQVRVPRHRPHGSDLNRLPDPRALRVLRHLSPGSEENGCSATPIPAPDGRG